MKGPEGERPQRKFEPQPLTRSKERGTLKQQVVADLEGHIRGRVFSPGQNLPNVEELMQGYGVGRDTIGDALKELSKKGLVRVGRGIRNPLVLEPSKDNKTSLKPSLGKVTESVVVRLRSIIQELPSGSKLTTEPELAKELQVSRGTLRAALRYLAAEDGSIESRKGKDGGTFVRDPSEPKQTGLLDDLRARILAKEWGDNGRLPTKKTLAELYGASHDAIAKALRQLAAEGLIASRAGAGIFVHEELLKMPTRVGEWNNNEMPWANAVRRRGGVPHQEIDTDTLLPPSTIADELGMTDSGLVFVHHRLRKINGRPYETARTFIPIEVVHRFKLQDPWNIRSFGDRIEGEITPRKATPDENNIFELRGQIPLQVDKKTLFLKGEPIATREKKFPTDRMVVVYSMDEKK